MAFCSGCDAMPGRKTGMSRPSIAARPVPSCRAVDICYLHRRFRMLASPAAMALSRGSEYGLAGCLRERIDQRLPLALSGGTS
jgi:hypothetical protein